MVFKCFLDDFFNLFNLIFRKLDFILARLNGEAPLTLFLRQFQLRLLTRSWLLHKSRFYRLLINFVLLIIQLLLHRPQEFVPLCLFYHIFGLRFLKLVFEVLNFLIFGQQVAFNLIHRLRKFEIEVFHFHCCLLHLLLKEFDPNSCLLSITFFLPFISVFLSRCVQLCGKKSD